MSNKVHPLVSIVIPVYNGANYMREAIDSALAQTYDNIEILVINDGSTDDGATNDIAVSYGEKIRYFLKENGGVVSALNFGIDHMEGEYFAWLSHDDLYKPDKIKKQLRALLHNKGPRPAFCVCNCIFIDENGKEKFRNSNLIQESFDNPQCSLFFGAGFNGIMVLIPKLLFDICGKFTPSLATHEYDMWLRLMNVADIIVVSDYLSLYRLHEKQILNQRKQAVTSEIDQFLGHKICEIPPLDFEHYFHHKGLQYMLSIVESYANQKYDFAFFQLLRKLHRVCIKKESPDNYVYSCENLSPISSIELFELFNHFADYRVQIYEQSFFWRLTKPMRMMVDLCRALKKYGLVGAIRKIKQKLCRWQKGA